jgi:hypothetical protein
VLPPFVLLASIYHREPLESVSATASKPFDRQSPSKIKDPKLDCGEGGSQSRLLFFNLFQVCWTRVCMQTAAMTVTWTSGCIFPLTVRKVA